LSQIVAEARRLLGLASGASAPVREAAELLGCLLLPDIEEVCPRAGEPMARGKEGTAVGRIRCVSDPEQRHARKSKSRRFTAHKASVTMDVDSQIIVAADVLAGDAADATGARELVEQAEQNTEQAGEETLGDCA
jgi:hypothetical protein